MTIDWLEFNDITSIRPMRRTATWQVLARGYALGEVRWFAPWRRYTFFPNEGTLYDAECMTRLAKFCADRTSDRKVARGLEKVRG